MGIAAYSVRRTFSLLVLMGCLLTAATGLVATDESDSTPKPDNPKLVGRFSGRVVGPHGEAVSDARLYIVPFYGDAKELGPVRAFSGKDGRFKFNAPDLTYT